MDPKRVTRKLRAILSADVQGYSRLMGDDEVATFKTITEYREIFSSIVKQYNGRVVDSPGDNILCEFASVVDAVQCAVEIQKVLKAKNEDLPENRRMIFRIGVNLGDVIHEDDRIYGDGVNIAARIESLAEGGGICISGSAYEQIENKLALGYNFIGEHSVKNISKPIRVYKVPMDPKDVGKATKPKPRKKIAIAVAVILILGIAAAAFWKFHVSPTAVSIGQISQKPSTVPEDKTPLSIPDEPSIAVLPFSNIGGDPKEEFLSDGFTEQIITALSRTPGLFVIASNSSFTYKGKAVKVQQVGRELGVRYVLEGSVQRSGDKLRITTQLIDAETGNHLWANKFNGDLKNIFLFQDEIALSVVKEMQIELVGGISYDACARGTKNIEAYLIFLKGMEYFKKGSVENNALAKQMFEKALELDPNYGAAYALIAWTYMNDIYLGVSKSPKESVAKAFQFAQRGVDSDNVCPVSLITLANVYNLMRQHDKAIEKCEQAISMDPSYAQGYSVFSFISSMAGQPDKALTLINKAFRLDPLPPPIYFRMRGVAYQGLGMYHDAITEFKNELKIAPNALNAHIRLAACYTLSGQEEKARSEVKEILKLNPKFTINVINSWSYKNEGDRKTLADALRKAGLPENPTEKIAEKPSIAVLPFDNITGDPKEQYLCDGFTEHIITVLAKVPDLSVTARNTSFTYKGKPTNIQELGKALNVGYVLEGSIQKSGDRIRVTAQLIDTSSGNHLWAETYDRNIANIFDLQDEIALKILKSLHIKLVAGSGMNPCARATDNVGAYLKFLQAVHYIQLGTIESLYLARQMCEESVKLDPGYGPGYALMAETYLVEIGFCLSKSPKQSVEKAFELANKALNVNNSCPYSRAVTGLICLFSGKYDKGLEEMKAAVAIDPNWPLGYLYLSNFFRDWNKAIELIEKAFRLNPLPPATYFAYLGRAYSRTGKYEEAITAFRDGLQMAPDNFWCHQGLAVVYVYLGREEEAHAEISEILKMNPHYSLACIGPILKSIGDDTKRKQLIEGLGKAGLK